MIKFNRHGISLSLRQQSSIHTNIKIVTLGGINYFDHRIIKTNWKKINKGPLQRAGNLVRIIARGSIKRRPHTNKKGARVPPSQPGTPPLSRMQGKSPPFKQIYSVLTNQDSSAIIGMTYLGEQRSSNLLNPVPGLHEHGGNKTVKVYVGPSGHQHRQNVNVDYPKRPFMIPALMKVKHQFPLLWRNAIR